MKRKVLRISEPVGEEKFGYAEAAVAGADLENRLSVGLTADPHVVLQMDDRLRLAGRAARVEEERHRVTVRRGVARLRRRSLDARPHIFNSPHLGIDRSQFGGIDDVRIDHRDPRAAVIENNAKIGRSQKRVDRHRDGARGD